MLRYQNKKTDTEIEGISFPKKRPTTLGNNTLKKYNTMSKSENIHI